MKMGGYLMLKLCVRVVNNYANFELALEYLRKNKKNSPNPFHIGPR